MNILTFTNQHRFLSNFYLESITYNDETFPSLENAYQANKTSKEHRKYFYTCEPRQAKRRGKLVPLRKDWEQVKLKIMKELIDIKFAQGSWLAAKLVATYPGELIEGNSWYDFFWGICNGKGLNHLGKLLMIRRQELIDDLESVVEEVY